MLIAGSDSYHDTQRLDPLEKSKRLLSVNPGNGFVPGEGASFLLLRRDPSFLGQGLDQAFKNALQNNSLSIDQIYSSMNGERYWSKEYGIAQLRNSQHFTSDCKTQHPADCYGDLGSATATTLMALSALNLFKQQTVSQHLVYCSSDTKMRGAVRVEKCHIDNV